MITLATFTSRVLAQGWTAVDRSHHGMGIVSAVYKQDGLILTGTFYPAWVVGVQEFSITLSDSATTDFVSVGQDDHTYTTFSMAWAILLLAGYQDNELEFCECEMCSPWIWSILEPFVYVPLHPYEQYDPELCPTVKEFDAVIAARHPVDYMKWFNTRSPGQRGL